MKCNYCFRTVLFWAFDLVETDYVPGYGGHLKVRIEKRCPFCGEINNYAG